MRTTRGREQNPEERRGCAVTQPRRLHPLNHMCLVDQWLRRRTLLSAGYFALLSEQKHPPRALFWELMRVCGMLQRGAPVWRTLAAGPLQRLQCVAVSHELLPDSAFPQWMNASYKKVWFIKGVRKERGSSLAAPASQENTAGY